ncbi:hypothetical protein EZV62_025221 [Acer yangbiense]|uniref:HMA domain-containing protein n=1 Tax=Acer yangbiense TaxID=1000413 RepID=A0A5C7GZ95_9ROSI|nr:hypothetical protein EZV62_025221 [Acer yangbiense]
MYDEINTCLKKMKLDGCSPDYITYNLLIREFARGGLLERMERLQKSMLLKRMHLQSSTLIAMLETVVLKVGMSCQGCVGAVKRVLGKMEGVESYDINIDEQKVTVKGNVQPDAVLQTVSKTGKKTAFWEEEKPAPAEAESKPVEAVAAA